MSEEMKDVKANTAEKDEYAKTNEQRRIRNEAITAQALTMSALQRTCVFLKRGKFLVNGKDLDAFVGDVSENAMQGIDICGGIQVGEWVFTVERSQIVPKNGFYIGGLFFGVQPVVHATFCQANVSATQSPQQALLAFVATRMWPILHAEEFVDALQERKESKEDIPVSWSIKQLQE